MPWYDVLFGSRDDRQLERIENKQDAIITMLMVLSQKEDVHMSDERDAFTELTAKVAKVQEVDASAVTLIQGLKASLDALVARLGDSPAAAEIASLSVSLDASSAALAAAVLANTPAAP